MYSVVMATMLVAGSATPDWHHHRCYSSCYGCYSCYSCYSGCYCSCYSGYHHHGHWGGYAGYSGYYGCYCSSCYSSCYSCSVVYYSSCYCSCSCGVYSPGVIISQPATPRVIEVPPVGKSEKVPPPVKKSEEASAPGQQKSRVTVVVPGNARLWVDNVECPLTSTVRSFDTPSLNASQQYVYNLKIELVRDGQTVTESRRAIITPGRPVQVDFNTGALTTVSR